MKIGVLFVVVIATVLTPALWGQEPVPAAPVPPTNEPSTPAVAPAASQDSPAQSPPAPATPSQEAAPVAEVATACLPSTTLDELVKALDDAVSGPANKDRVCLRELLLPEGRMSPMEKKHEAGLVPHLMSAEEWAAAAAKRGGMKFYERQVKVSSDVYGRIAQLWSNYEIRLKPDGKPIRRGINSIQAVNDGTRWRVLEILWQEETRDEPVPEKYLP
jgi:hypothetical protein